MRGPFDDHSSICNIVSTLSAFLDVRSHVVFDLMGTVLVGENMRHK